MALYLGNNKISMKSGYTTTGLKDFLEHGGKFAYSKITDFTGILKYEDMSNVTDMSYMFFSCYNINSIPLLDTSNVNNMLYMFSRCYKLATIPKLETSNVTTMSNMFYSCESLASIPQLDTSNVTDMNEMFYLCSSLVSIPKLDTSKVTNANNMFGFCRKLTAIPQLDMSNVDTNEYMFYMCSNLTEIHITGMKVSFNISSSTKFTREALVEIINNLATITNTQTLTMGATNLAKLTNEDKSIATNKGWTLA